MTILKDFYELYPPERDSVAFDEKDWTAYDKDTCLRYLMNDGSNCLVDLLGNTNAPTVTFYFDTEVQCHEAASRYYSTHGEQYPYYDEWQAASDRERGVTTTQPITLGNNSQTIQSEPMEF